MSESAKKAAEIFDTGCNCAQAVFCAFCGETDGKTGLDRETAMRIASSFGGGMGDMREVCGALTGSFMVLGCARGYGVGPSREEKKSHGVLVRQIANAFKEQYGSIMCRDLLKKNKLDGLEGERRPCTRYVVSAAEYLEKLIQE